MNLTASQLEELESLGELQFTISECAIILRVNADEFDQAMQEQSAIYNTYERGRLKASAAVRKAILQQAKQGSTPAQKQMLDLIASASKQRQTQVIHEDLNSNISELLESLNV